MYMVNHALRSSNFTTNSPQYAGFRAMKDRMSDVRKEFMEIAKNDKKPTGVYQFNFQIFPVTKLESLKK